MSHTRQGAIAGLAALLLVVTAAADTLNVDGEVEDSGQNPIEGATVTVTVLSLGESITSQTTTDAQGGYSVAIDNPDGFRVVAVAVSAPGYGDEQAQRIIANPADGTPDALTVNFALDLIVYDTLVVTGLVVDESSGDSLSGARLIISYRRGFSGPTFTDTAQSGADGRVALSSLTEAMPTQINWTVGLAGYQAEGRFQSVRNDTVNIGTVRLVAYAPGDSVTYTVSGRVTDEIGGSVADADVIVTIVQGADTLVFDTVGTMGFGANYTATSEQVPYSTTDVTVTVAVEGIQGYDRYEHQLTVASSTTDVGMDVQLIPASSVRPSPYARTVRQAETVTLYGLNGRVLARTDGSRLKAVLRGGIGNQPLILRHSSGDAVWSELVPGIR
jgi:hypothetical protein